MPGPQVACIGVIGKAENPLHISLFPPYLGSAIEFSFLLNSSLDIFDIRQKQTSIDQDLGLLHAVDERLASYGWLTTTGVKFIVILDIVGEQASTNVGGSGGAVRSRFRESDLKPVRTLKHNISPDYSSTWWPTGSHARQVFRALQTAYIQLLQNPFYSPDDHLTMTNGAVQTTKPFHITDQKFIAEVNRIGSSWTAGIST